MKTLKLLCVIALMCISACAEELFASPSTISHAMGPAVIPIVMGILSLLQMGSQAVTQSKAQKESKKYQTELEKRRTDYDAWFKGEYNQDFLDTEQGRSTLNQLGQSLKNTTQNNQTGAIRSGATTETQVAAQGGAMDTYAQALNQLTSQGTQYKQNLRNGYDYNIQNYLRPLDQMAQGRINNWTQLGGQIGDSSAGLITALGSYDWNLGVATTP